MNLPKCYSLVVMLLALPTPATEMLDSFQAGLYDISARTVMPHLEENLRYAITHERRCIQQQELPVVFPILGHYSLQNCGLGNMRHTNEYLELTLHCQNQNTAAGSARLFVAPGHFTGELSIKMGGKNMTFSQRIVGKRVRSDECQI